MKIHVKQLGHTCSLTAHPLLKFRKNVACEQVLKRRIFVKKAPESYFQRYFPGLIFWHCCNLAYTTESSHHEKYGFKPPVLKYNKLKPVFINL